MPFSRGSSRPRDQTWVSCMAGGFFTVCTTREALKLLKICPSLESLTKCKPDKAQDKKDSKKTTEAVSQTKIPEVTQYRGMSKFSPDLAEHSRHSMEALERPLVLKSKSKGHSRSTLKSLHSTQSS